MKSEHLSVSDDDSDKTENAVLEHAIKEFVRLPDRSPKLEFDKEILSYRDQFMFFFSHHLLHYLFRRFDNLLDLRNPMMLKHKWVIYEIA